MNVFAGKIYTLSITSKFMTLISVFILSGCVQQHGLQTLENPSGEFYGEANKNGYLFTQQSVAQNVFSATLNCDDRQDFAASLNYRVDKPILSSASNQAPLPIANISARNALPLSPGDLIEVMMEYGEGFNGSYVLDNLGLLSLPIINAIDAGGLSPKELAERIELALIKSGIFRPAMATVHIKILHLAEIQIPVTGAVFKPGRILINKTYANGEMDERVVADGVYSNKRLLSEAIRGAHGVRPDAKIDQIILIRQGWQIEVDLTGILSGV
ncbi:MAG: polysaccharide export outer membrane protein, partial [Paraglaciecola sp.]